ncbi:hypothetical protein TanjilG_32304 [Lupinus angustifolius]|uniref:Uncharacterized protein n=1 Tax=Lupinus angustifolius TaxID=3871 RepID=A0A4P1R0M9_LUPAN|nr:hypothetical protein TanjilG_32304 [Lupinus angustifolius]
MRVRSTRDLKKTCVRENLTRRTRANVAVLRRVYFFFSLILSATEQCMFQPFGLKAYELNDMGTGC